MAKAGRGDQQYMLRLPGGLRDRIKAYSERMGTSINSEIVKVLERDFPEQWSVDNRMEELTRMLSILSAGKDDPRLDEFLEKFEETVEGIISGRVTGVDAEIRSSIIGMWRSFKDRESEAAYNEEQDRQMEYTDEEIEAFELTGRFEKYPIPPAKKPEPFKDYANLMEILAPDTLAELNRRLSKADIAGAADLIAGLDPKQLKRAVEEQQLSMFERERLRQEREDAFPENNDPFKVK